MFKDYLKRAKRNVASPTLLYVLFFFQGIGLLFPWNSIVTSFEYYKIRLASLENSAAVIAYFGVIFMTVKLIFMTTSSLTVHLLTLEKQVIFSGIGNVVIFLLLTILSRFDELDAGVFLALTLVLLFIASLFCAFMNNALYIILGRYSPRYMQAISNGQGLAGVLASIAKIITVSITKSDTSSTTEIVLYYSVSTVIMACCTILFMVFHDTPEASTTSPLSSDKLAAVEDLKDEAAASSEDKHAAASVGKASHYPATVDVDVKAPLDAETAQSRPVEENSMSLLRDYYRVLKEVMPYAMGIFVVFFVTLGFFPYFYYSTVSTEKEGFYYTKLFILMNFVLFNLGDWIGKSLPLIKELTIKNAKVLLIASLARIAFLPLFLLSNIRYDNYPVSRALASDGLFYAVALLFGVSSGYLATLIMMYGPPSVANPKDRSKSATVMVFFLTLGLTFGTYFWAALENIIKAVCVN